MTKTGRLTLPAEIRREMGLTDESTFDVEADPANDIIHLRPRVTIPREDAWAYTPEMRQIVARYRAEVAAGTLREYSLSEEDLKKIAEKLD